MRLFLKIFLISVIILFLSVQIALPIVVRKSLDTILNKVPTDLNLNIQEINHSAGFLSTDIQLKEVNLFWNKISYTNDEVDISYTLFHPQTVFISISPYHKVNGFRLKLDPIVLEYNLKTKKITGDTTMLKHLGFDEMSI